MEFDKIIKKLRKDNNLTQEDLAESLNVSRQAISNWENNKNLPDIGMLIIISKKYSISLDDLILGDNNMTKIEKKIIKDGSDSKIARTHMVSNVVGLIFCLIGLCLIFIKGSTVEYIDKTGILYENFFLLPISFAFIVIGIIIIFINLGYLYIKSENKLFVLNKLGYLFVLIFLVLTILIYSNSNKISIVTSILTILGIVLTILTNLKKE